MSELHKKYGAPALASVNLIPSEIAEKRKARAVQLTALLVVLVAVGVLVAVYVVSLGAKQLAQNDLSNARDDQTIALQERDAKKPVYDSYRAREQQEFALTQIGFGEIDYATLSATVLSVADDATSFESVEFFGPSALGFGSEQEGYYGGGVGTVQFVARAESSTAARELIARLEDLPGIAKVHGTTEAYATDAGDDFWRVQGSGLITASMLTSRLVPQDGVLTLDPLQVALTESGVESPVEATPAPSASPSADEEN